MDILLPVILLLFVLVVGVSSMHSEKLRRKSRDWPEVEGVVIGRIVSSGSEGGHAERLRVDYFYSGRRYREWSESFLLDEVNERSSFDGVQSTRPFYRPKVGESVKLRVDPEKPSSAAIVPPF